MRTAAEAAPSRTHTWLETRWSGSSSSSAARWTESTGFLPLGSLQITWTSCTRAAGLARCHCHPGVFPLRPPPAVPRTVASCPPPGAGRPLRTRRSRRTLCACPVHGHHFGQFSELATNMRSRRKQCPRRRGLTPGDLKHAIESQPAQPLQPPVSRRAVEVAAAGIPKWASASAICDLERMGFTKPFPPPHRIVLPGRIWTSAATKGAHCWTVVASAVCGGVSGPVGPCLAVAAERAKAPVCKVAPATPTPRIPRTAGKMHSLGCCCPDGAEGPRSGPGMGRLGRTLSRVSS